MMASSKIKCAFGIFLSFPATEYLLAQFEASGAPRLVPAVANKGPLVLLLSVYYYIIYSILCAEY